MNKFSIKEFKPTILFLLKFIGLYIGGSLLYGLYVTAYYPRPDPATHLVSVQTGYLLSAFGWPVEVIDSATNPYALLIHKGRSVVSVYEGCNGLNTIIIFVAFLFAFGPVSRTMLWFVPLGILCINLTNIFRIFLLFIVAETRPDYMYFVHKYFFTAVIYAVIFILWVWWVKKYAWKK